MSLKITKLRGAESGLIVNNLCIYLFIVIYICFQWDKILYLLFVFRAFICSSICLSVLFLPIPIIIFNLFFNFISKYIKDWKEPLVI